VNNLIVALLFSLFAGFAENAVAGLNNFVTMTDAQEVAYGAEADKKLREDFDVYDSVLVHNYVNGVGQRLAKHSERPNLKYHFTVLDSPDIDTFSQPGGYVYITRGLLAYLNSELDLAMVLAHEIGHISARHDLHQKRLEQVSDIGLSVASLFVPNVDSIGTDLVARGGVYALGLKNESEAELLAGKLLTQAGYNIQCNRKLKIALKNQELQDVGLAKLEGRDPYHYHGLLAYCANKDCSNLKTPIAETDKCAPYVEVNDRNELLDATEGLSFGGNDGNYVVRNNAVYYNELGVGLLFPKNWQIHNQEGGLAVNSPQEEVSLQVKFEDTSMIGVSDYAYSIAGKGIAINLLNVNKLSAAIFESTDTIGGIVFFGKQTFVLQAKSKNNKNLALFHDDIVNTIQSFHPLLADEYQLAKPIILHNITTQAGDTFAKLAQQCPLGNSSEIYLRLVNGQYPSGEPRTGERVKVFR
jgi:predicted Zn-dependent protease